MERSDFDTVFRGLYSPLYFFARQYVDDEDECRDIVSSAFESLWKNISSIDTIGAKRFLYVTIRNSCVDYARHDQRHRKYVKYVEAMSGYAADPSAILEREELQERVNRNIDSLKPPTRDIFIACYIEKKKYKEVAAEMNISTSTVKKHIIRALKAMRESVSKINLKT